MHGPHDQRSTDVHVLFQCRLNAPGENAAAGLLSTKLVLDGVVKTCIAMPVDVQLMVVVSTRTNAGAVTTMTITGRLVARAPVTVG